jgi:hypothetical protein
MTCKEKPVKAECKRVEVPEHLRGQVVLDTKKEIMLQLLEIAELVEQSGAAGFMFALVTTDTPKEMFEGRNVKMASGARYLGPDVGKLMAVSLFVNHVQHEADLGGE